NSPKASEWISSSTLMSVPVWEKAQIVKATAVAAVIRLAPRCQLRSGPRKPVGAGASADFREGMPGIVEFPRGEEEGRSTAAAASGLPVRGRGHSRPSIEQSVNFRRTPGDVTVTARPA